MNSQKPASSMPPRQCEIVTRARANTFPGAMSTESMFSSERGMENAASSIINSQQQDLDAKSDPQDYLYSLQGYQVFGASQAAAQGKPGPRSQVQRRHSISQHLPSPAASTKKKNAKKIPRPKNCFMAYRMDKQHDIMARFPGVNNKDISRIVGKMWKQESKEQKDHYRAIAEKLKKEHARDYPGYKFSPKKKTQKNLKKQEPSLVSTKFNSNDPDKCNNVFNTQMHEHTLQHPPYTTASAAAEDHILAMQAHGFPNALILASIHQDYHGSPVDSIKSDSPFSTVSSKYHHQIDQYSQCMLPGTHLGSPVQFEVRSEIDGTVSFSHISGFSSNQSLEEEYASGSEDYLSDGASPESIPINSPLSRTADNVQIAQPRFMHQDAMMPSMPVGYSDELFNTSEDNGFMKVGSDMGQSYFNLGCYQPIDQDSALNMGFWSESLHEAASL